MSLRKQDTFPDNSTANLEGIWKLSKKQDALKEKLAALDQQITIWKQLLCSRNAEEISNLAEEFFPHRKDEPFHEEAAKALKERSLKFGWDFQKLTGMSVGLSSDGKTIVRFYPPQELKTSMFLLALEMVEGKYRLTDSTLPSSFPLHDIEAALLTEKQDVEKFLRVIREHLDCFWCRDIEYQRMQNLSMMNSSITFRNSNRTLISFTLEFMETSIEVQVFYKLLSLMPHEVKFHADEKDNLNPKIKNGLESLRQLILEMPLSSVLSNLQDNLDVEGQADGKDVSSDASDDTTVFQL